MEPLRIAVTGAEPGELADWLAGDSRLRGRLGRESARPDGTMGAGEILTAAIGDGGLIAVLASALTTWLLTRRNRSRVRIKVTGPDGRGVEVDAQSEDVQALLRTLLPLAELPEPRDGT